MRYNARANAAKNPIIPSERMTSVDVTGWNGRVLAMGCWARRGGRYRAYSLVSACRRYGRESCGECDLYIYTNCADHVDRAKSGFGQMC